ncbi:MAG TPA: winged helix-turn-helix domain-containing protein [Bryobacteraceae bacterium]|nr:winged helix-turn-helix domain-containing protein [Bryobacteraceae bacterium]
MASQPARMLVASFGPFQLDYGKGELRKHGVRIRLARQPWQVLVMLAERPGELVSREEIRQQLWSADTFVDFEHGLNATMNRLRQALGDSAENPRYIETLPGRGYRFLAPVQTAGPVSNEVVSAEAVPTVGTGSSSPIAARTHTVRSRIPSWLVIAACSAVVTALALTLIWNNKQVQAPGPSRVVRFTVPAPDGYGLEPAGSRQAFAVSPDGSRLAFTALGDDGRFRLWVRDLAELEPREAPDTAGLHSVFWSPSGDSLYYSVRGTVRRIATQGGSAQQIISELPQVLHLGTWLSPDRMLLSNRVASFLVPTSGGTPTRLDQTYVWPQVLPDGKHILSIAYDERLHRNRLRVAEFGKPDTTRDILETDSRVTWVRSNAAGRPGHLLYVRGGTLIAHPFDVASLKLAGEAVPLVGGVHFFQPTGAADFSVSQNGVLVYQTRASGTEMEWRDRQGGSVSKVGPARLSTKCVRLSPDGAKIAAAVHNRETGATELWLFNASTGAGRVFVPGPGVLDAPVWSADSQRLLYSRALGSAPKLYIRGLGEQDPEEPLPVAPFQLPTDWSRDGRFVLYTNTAFPASANELEGNVGLIDLQTREIKQLLNSSSQETNAVFSPDGGWIAYISNDSGQPEAYMQAFDSGSLKGERIRVSKAGALYVRWRGDGKEIVYLGTDGLLYGVPVGSSAVRAPRSPVPLFRVSIASRTILPTTFGFDITSDGSRVLMPGAGMDKATHLTVVQDWEAGIRTRK